MDGPLIPITSADFELEDSLSLAEMSKLLQGVLPDLDLDATLDDVRDYAGACSGEGIEAHVWGQDAICKSDQLMQTSTEDYSCSSAYKISNNLGAQLQQEGESVHSAYSGTFISTASMSTDQCMMLDDLVPPAQQEQAVKKRTFKRCKSNAERKARLMERNRAAQKAFRDRQKEKAVEKQTAVMALQAELEELRQCNLGLRATLQQAELQLQAQLSSERHFVQQCLAA